MAEQSFKIYKDTAERLEKNALDIANLKEDLDNLNDKKITKFYASNQGNTHLPDSDKGKIQDMYLYGKSEQVQYKGKNLLNATAQTQTVNGITLTNNGDGTFTLNGTTGSEKAVYFVLQSFTFKKGINYKMVGVPSGLNRKVGLEISESPYYGEFGSGVTFSFENDFTVNIRIKAVENAVFSNVVLKPMIVDTSLYPDTTYNDYEPYVGGIPSPNPDYPQEIKTVVNPKVVVRGKNLLKLLEANAQINSNGLLATMNADGSISVTGTSTANWSNIIKIDNKCHTDNATYTFSVEKKPDIVIGLKLGRNKLQDANYQTHRIMQNQLSCTFDTGASNEYCSLFLEGLTEGKSYNFTIYPMLEKGSEVTSYEPYTEQSATLPYTLNAIPVTSGGNVTIDGRQYIADRVVEKDGAFGIERNTATDAPVLTKKLKETPDTKGRFLQEFAFKKKFAPQYEPMVNIGYGKTWGISGNMIDKWIFGVNEKNLYITPPKDLNYTSEDVFNALKDLNIKVYGALSTSIFEPLPEDIQAKLRALSTNYPVTNISVESDQLDGYTVFNYPISMAEGWNYVKQKIGDTRDYIYDMDLQSAEAYVNSEYAVALTELEV